MRADVEASPRGRRQPSCTVNCRRAVFGVLRRPARAQLNAAARALWRSLCSPRAARRRNRRRSQGLPRRPSICAARTGRATTATWPARGIRRSSRSRRRTSTSCAKRGRTRSELHGTALAGSELTPLVVGARALRDGRRSRRGVDAPITGAEIWRFALPQGEPSQRGLAYWPGDATTAARIFFTAGRTLLALDAATGQRVPAFGTEGELQLPAAYNGAPTRYDDLLIVGSNGPPGGVRAYDARSGEERWSFAGAPTLRSPASSLTVDVDRALVYAVFAGPEPDVFYGGERAEADPHLNSVVALDAHTGARRWHFQTVHHDIWDYDLTAPPVLARCRDRRCSPARSSRCRAPPVTSTCSIA